MTPMFICNIHTPRNRMSGRRLKHRARLGGAVPIVPPGEDYRTPSAAVEEVTELFLTRYGARTPDRLGQSSFVAKTRGRDPGIRLVQTVFKTPFLGHILISVLP